ncbi:SDR family oxidoreductase [Halorubrum sp. SD626R]|uniref:SDR family NAD(P)-dependent oxidoreductase n=1 Tax=Halorubrum sp. SD626R TaxID=1419722 RepID=UPI0010FA5C24|nr:SDR family oxidoreductase [Halorubrum sp. SD626R]TKX79406.1 SDR family oxidoreductase [Halorubrum sp. SD626R]
MTEIGKNRLDSCVTIVTGSTRGIGAGIARQIAAEGAIVVVTGRGSEEGKSVAAEIRDAGGEAVFHATDVQDPKSITALFDATIDHFDRLDILVNNAAVQTATTAGGSSIENWERVVETNLRGYWLCAKTAADRMDRGAIVNVSSNHASRTMPAHFPYNVTKGGIDTMTKAMCLDFGPHIRVNSVNPGWISVERTTGEMEDERHRELESIHPVGRIGNPEDVAAAVTFLASDEASFVNGTCLYVDGGRSAVMQDDVLPDYRRRRQSEQ